MSNWTFWVAMTCRDVLCYLFTVTVVTGVTVVWLFVCVLCMCSRFTSIVQKI